MAIETDANALAQPTMDAAGIGAAREFLAAEDVRHPGVAPRGWLSGTAAWEDYPDRSADAVTAADDDTDDLAASRGITTAALVGSAMWACVGLAVWLM